MADGTAKRSGGLESYPKLGFWALIATQFQGAFNDNLFQFVITFFMLASYQQMVGGDFTLFGHSFNVSVSPEDFVPSFATLLFSLPFIIFPVIFGALADRYSKQRVAMATKYLEIVIMMLGGVAFYIGNPVFIWGVLFLMATQSAMFAPAKYGILPEILPESRLSWGNGIIQMGTIVAIIAGTGLAGPVYQGFSSQIYLVSGVLILLSVFGTFTSHFIARPPAANPSQVIPKNILNPWRGMGKYLKVIFSDRVLLNVVIGYTYFWFAGALVRQNVIKYATSTLGLGESLTTYLLAAVALGIGIGAVMAGYLSRGKIEQGFILIGAMGMAVFGTLVSIPPSYHEAFTIPAGRVVVAALTGGYDSAVVQAMSSVGGYYILLLGFAFLLGAFAGMFDVPLAATLQQRAPNNMKGGIISTTNMLTFVGMAFASVVFLLFGMMGFTPNHIFLVIGLVSLLMGAYMSWKIPILVLRAVLWMMDGTLFKLRVNGRKNIPEREGALLVADHNSLIDCLAIQAALDREVCFVVGKEVLGSPFLRFLTRFLRVVLVDSSSEKGVAEAAGKVRAAVAEGWVVCVNRERRLGRDGMELPWHKDYFSLVEGTGAPVLPLSMTRLWERVYIFRDNRLVWRWWGRFRYPVQVWIGAAVPPGTSAVRVRTAVERTCMDAYFEREYEFKLLHHGLVKMARRRMRHMAIADALTGSLSYFKVLVGTIVFARKLRPLLGSGDNVGLLVPPTVGGALANLAVQMLGKIPVNLNYTAPSETIASCASRSGITHTITSRKFLERLPLDVPGTPVYLEDVRQTVSGKDRVIGMVLALFAPVWLLEKVLGSTRRTDQDLATIIFSSGSEGEPKGVMLTHRNIITIVESAQEMFPHNWNSCLVGFLPLFHSFGYAVCLWTPLLAGIRVIFHPNPLEPKAIGSLSQKFGGSIMIGTATFLQGFIRRCEPEQLKSLDYVVCGAEKLPERIRSAFNEKFGVEPVEGYGTTECAPAVSINMPDCESPGFFIANIKHGSIGRPMTGQTVRVVDPDTGAELSTGESGLLLVKGPNIMRGYLNDPKKTAAVLQDGWYSTGDIAALDEDGFITITDRLARFSKIAGEMVPHTRVEELLHGMLGLTDQSMVVASVPDTAKGERLVVLHILTDEQLEELLKKLNDSDLPNLWRPKATSFYRIDEIPVLGTGKMDIKKAKKIALSLDIGE